MFIRGLVLALLSFNLFAAETPVGTIKIPNGNNIMVCEVDRITMDASGNTVTIIPTNCVTQILNYPQFDDVPSTYWAYRAITTLAALGITSGCGDTNYCPEDTVSRAQLAVFLYRALHLEEFVVIP